jgi:hypothetical protein
MSPAAALSGYKYRSAGIKTPKIVVRMQHTRRTCIENIRTPKKAADACLFCFTGAAAQTTV